MYKDLHVIHIDYVYGGGCTVFFPVRGQKLLPAVKKTSGHFESFLFPHIWHLELYLMPGKLNLKSILKGFEVDRFSRSPALCSD